MHSLNTCRATGCLNLVRYLSLCERHYHRAHRAGLKAKDINALSADEIIERFGSGDKLPTIPEKKKVVQATIDAQTDARIVESNIRLARRVKEIEAEAKGLEGIIKQLQKENSVKLGLLDGQRKKVRELEALVESLGKQVIELNGELDAATRPGTSAPSVPVPGELNTTHGELVIAQVDLDPNSRLRVTLRGEGCRDVAHLVGRKIRLSRLDPKDR